jgi:hypothetical protein
VNDWSDAESVPFPLIFRRGSTVAAEVENEGYPTRTAFLRPKYINMVLGLNIRPTFEVILLCCFQSIELVFHDILPQQGLVEISCKIYHITN